MKTKKVLQLLRDYESQNVTFMESDGSWPIVWERAKGVHVWNADGKKYLDLTGAFGVAAAGHANSNVVKAGQKQMAKLLHAMGDVHPHELKAKLARNRDTHPLFDTLRFTRQLETAYRRMWERAQSGAQPESFAVEARS